MAMPEPPRGDGSGSALRLRTCPTCGGQATTAAQFCEQCGAELPPGPPSAARRGLIALFTILWLLLTVGLLIWLYDQALILK